MNADKAQVRHCMLQYFHRREIAVETTKIVCGTQGQHGYQGKIICHISIIIVNF